MALVLADRVRDTTTTTGTGTVTLSGTAPTGYQNFSVVGNGNTTYYTINAGSQWEVGIGTYSSTGPTLSRDTVLSSSSSGSLVNFSAGTKDVFLTYPSGKSVYQDNSTIKAGSAVLAVPNGGTGAATLTGYVKGTGTAALTASATIPASDISSGAALTEVDDTNVTLTLGGSPTTALLAATSITAGWTGQLAVSRGGTGASTLTANGVLLGNGTSAISATAVGTTGQVLVGNTGAAPSWATLSSSAVTSFSAGTTGFTPSTATTGAITLAGTLNVANGGTGASTLTSGYLLKGNGTSAVSASVVYDNGTNVGIGTASPSYALSVVNDGSYTKAGADTLSSIIYMNKGRGSVIAPTNISSGDNLGAIWFNGYSGSGNNGGYGYGAYIGGQADGPVYVGTVPGRLVFATTSSGTSSPTERMRIDSSGNVGIGTSGPGVKLDVAGDIRSTSGNYYAANGGVYGWGSLATYVGGSSATNIITFQTNSSERMRIDSSGNVGIGTSSPQVRVHISTVDQSTNRVRLQNTGTGGGNFDIIGGLAGVSNAGLSFYDVTNAATRMYIDSSGNVGIGTSSPAVKLDVNGGINLGATLISGGGVSTGDVAIELGGNRSGSGNCYIDLHSTNGTDFESRIIRYPGANGGMDITNSGTGALNLSVLGAGNIVFNNAGNERMRIDSSGNVGIGTSSPGSVLQLNKASGSVDLRLSVGGTLYTNFYASASDTSLYSVQALPLILGTNNTERMRILSTGKVLIGSTADADAAPFQVNANAFGNGTYTARFENSASGTNVYNAVRWFQGASGSAVGIIGTGGSTVGNAAFQNRFVVGTQNNTALTFVSNDTFRGMIDGGGQFWWGAQSTIDTVSFAPFQITNAIAINTNTTSATTAMSFFNGQGSGVRVGYIGTSGSSTSYNTSSDERLKKNIADAADAGSVIDAIQVRQFDWKINDEHQRYGMIAQELDEVFPEAVAHGPTETDMLAVDYSKLVPMLVKEVQSLRARVAQLEGK